MRKWPSYDAQTARLRVESGALTHRKWPSYDARVMPLVTTTAAFSQVFQQYFPHFLEVFRARTEHLRPLVVVVFAQRQA